MDDLITIIAFMLGVPFCGIVLAVTVAVTCSLADFLMEILSRLKWRLLDYLDRKFSEEVTVMRTIKFRGRDMNSDFVYGLLTKKKIRSSGEIRWAIATGNCSAAETIPITENSISQLVGLDSAGNEVYEGDTIIDCTGKEFTADIGFFRTIDRFHLQEAEE